MDHLLVNGGSHWRDGAVHWVIGAVMQTMTITIGDRGRWGVLLEGSMRTLLEEREGQGRSSGGCDCFPFSVNSTGSSCGCESVSGAGVEEVSDGLMYVGG